MRTVQTAIEILKPDTPALPRPVLVSDNGDKAQARLGSPVFKKIVEQPAQRNQSEADSPDVTSRDEAPGRVIAGVVTTISPPIADPSSSSLYLAQRIAQENQTVSLAKKADDEAAIAAYREADERGTVFYGLEYPVDFSV